MVVHTHLHHWVCHRILVDNATEMIDWTTLVVGCICVSGIVPSAVAIIILTMRSSQVSRDEERRAVQTMPIWARVKGRWE